MAGLVVEKARELRDGQENAPPFDHVWVVFDRDSFPPDDFDNAIKKAESQEMKAAWSNEAFELWYILHFEYRSTPMPRDKYQRKLKKLTGRPYKKNAEDMYRRISEEGSQAQAINWARKLHDEVKKAANTPPSQANPCTTVYLLVEELNKFKPPRAI